MLADTIGGTGLYVWTQPGGGGNNTLGNGVANIVYAPWTPVLDAEQLGLLFMLDTTAGGAYPAGGGAVVRMQWAPDQGLAAPTVFAEEPIEQLGTPAAGVERDLINIKEWGPATASFLIWRPAAAHLFRVGVYASAAPGANARVRLFVERQRTSTGLQRTGG
jgi:hypothetical protein